MGSLSRPGHTSGSGLHFISLISTSIILINLLQILVLADEGSSMSLELPFPFSLGHNEKEEYANVLLTLAKSVTFKTSRRGMRADHNLIRILFNVNGDGSPNPMSPFALFGKPRPSEPLFYIPADNSRQIQISNLSNYPPEEREHRKEILMQIILENEPLLEDKMEIQELETKLLEKGITANCKWVKELPPPLFDDQQCSVEELTKLLETF